MKVFLYSICIIFFAFPAISASNIDESAHVDPILFELLERKNSVDCLILFTEKADLRGASSLKTKEEKGTFVFKALQHVQQKSQAEVLEYLHKQNANYNSFFIANGIAAQLTKVQILKIAEFKGVKSIAHDPSVRREKTITENSSITRELPEPEWGIKMIQADSVWRLGIDGTGVVVGGQDTGFEWEHPVLIKKYRGYNESLSTHDYHWHDAIREHNPENADSINPCGYDSPVPCDDHNHGTHTMGTMIGSDSLNAIGVAPNAKWIACRNMERGIGKPSTYIECFEWFLAPTNLDNEFPDPLMAPDVINNSWSCPVDEGCNETNWEMMEDAIINLKTAGIVVIVSAGNDGRDGCGTIAKPPAMFASSYAIGATRANDTIAAFSSRGPVSIDSSFRLKPDVSAPGHNVRSAIRNGEFRSFSGTSMAGPHVVGAVALIINANPELRGQVSTIENILTQTAEIKFDDTDCFDVLGQNSPNHTYGSGRINVLKAVEMAQAISSVEPDRIDEHPFTLYPNPTNNIVFIEGPEINTINYNVNVYNMKGQLMLTQSNSPASLNVATLESGVYVVRLQTGSGASYRKLVVE